MYLEDVDFSILLSEIAMVVYILSYNTTHGRRHVRTMTRIMVTMEVDVTNPDLCGLHFGDN